MCVVWRIFSIPNRPSRSGHVPAVRVEGRTVSVGDRIFVVVVVVVDVLMCVMLRGYVGAFFRLGHVAEARILLRQRHVRFSNVVIAVYDVAVLEARQLYVLRDFEIGFIIVSSTVALDGVKLVGVWLSDIVVQVTLPKYMLGCGPGIFACFAFAFVIFDGSRREQAVG